MNIAVLGAGRIGSTRCRGVGPVLDRNGLRGFSPQLVAYRNGSVASNGSTEAFSIEDGPRRLVLKVSWKRGNSIDFSVARNGVDVTSAGRFISGAFYKIFVIEFEYQFVNRAPDAAPEFPCAHRRYSRSNR